MSTLSKINLNPFQDGIVPGISLCTAVMNRSNTLEEALKTWITWKEIDEIIIVDWSSETSLIPLVKRYQNGKIHLVVVKDQKKWVLSHAYNLAARLTSKDKILKIDADVKILPGFFDRHVLQPGMFYTGNCSLGRDENERHLNGNAFYYRQDFFNVNGYSEFIKFYGWDDDDLFTRMEALGLKKQDLDINTLFHIEHAHRTTFQDSADYFKNLSDNERAELNILINRYVSNHHEKWSSKKSMLEFSVKVVDNHTVVCEQKNSDQNLLPPSLLSDSESWALEERLKQNGVVFPDNLLKRANKIELAAFYNQVDGKNSGSMVNPLFDLILKFNESYSNLIVEKEEESFRLNIAIRDQKFLLDEHIRCLDETMPALLEKEQVIRSKDLVIVEKEAIIADQIQKLNSHAEIINQSHQIIQEKDLVLSEQKRIIDEKNQQFYLLELAMVEALKHGNAQDQIIQKKEHLIQEKEQAIDQAVSLIRHKEEVIMAREQAILNCQKTLDQKEKQLLDVQYELSAILRSYSWRFGHSVFSAIGKIPFAPKGKMQA